MSAATSDALRSNSSGHGPASVVPREIRRWNWGAFLLNWIWGLGNRSYVALLVFVPLFGFVMMFILGAKGSTWAWQNRRWDSIEQFRASQRRWAWWGLAAWIVGPLLVFGSFLATLSSLRDADVYKLAVAQLESSTELRELVGAPIETGLPMGSFSVSGPRGTASLSFAVTGPRGKGTAFVEARKELGLWKLDRLVFEHEPGRRRIDLVGGESSASAADAVMTPGKLPV